MVAFKQTLPDFRTIQEHVVIIVIDDRAANPLEHHQRVRIVMIRARAQPTRPIATDKPAFLALPSSHLLASIILLTCPVQVQRVRKEQTNGAINVMVLIALQVLEHLQGALL